MGVFDGSNTACFATVVDATTQARAIGRRVLSSRRGAVGAVDPRFERVARGRGGGAVASARRGRSRGAVHTFVQRLDRIAALVAPPAARATTGRRERRGQGFMIPGAPLPGGSARELWLTRALYWASAMCCFYTPVQWVMSCLQWAASETMCHLPPGRARPEDGRRARRRRAARHEL